MYNNSHMCYVSSVYVYLLIVENLFTQKVETMFVIETLEKNHKMLSVCLKALRINSAKLLTRSLCICNCLCVCVCVCARMCRCACVCECMLVHVCMHVRIHVHMHVCMCVCMRVCRDTCVCASVPCIVLSPACQCKQKSTVDLVSSFLFPQSFLFTMHNFQKHTFASKQDFLTTRSEAYFPFPKETSHTFCKQASARKAWPSLSTPSSVRMHAQISGTYKKN